MNHKRTTTRKELKNKLATVFVNKIQNLPLDLQDVLLDDLVTAFESRIDALRRASLTIHCASVMTESVQYETI